MGRFPRLPFNESMARYGNDKPDLRFGIEHIDITKLIVDLKGGGFPLWEELANDPAVADAPEDHLRPRIVKALVIPARAGFSRLQMEEIEKGLKEIKGFRGLARAKVADDGAWTQSPAHQVHHGRCAREDQPGGRCQAGRHHLLPVRPRRRSSYRDGKASCRRCQAHGAHSGVRARRGL